MTGKHGDKGMKRITFYGYATNCNCTYCSALREIMDRDSRLHINSFKIEEDSHMSVPKVDGDLTCDKSKEPPCHLEPSIELCKKCSLNANQSSSKEVK
jgi:hypothetical protein